MARTFFDAVALFLSPFVAYGILLVLRQRYPFVAESWSRGSLAGLTVAGLGLVVLGMVVTGLLASRHRGAYVPAHIEGGRLVPGHIE